MRAARRGIAFGPDVPLGRIRDEPIAGGENPPLEHTVRGRRQFFRVRNGLGRSLPLIFAARRGPDIVEQGGRRCWLDHLS